jgi:hypothetical protein
MGKDLPAAYWIDSLFWQRNAANSPVSSAAPFLAVPELRHSLHGGEPFD